MGQQITIDAKPETITIDTAQTAVIVVDMQNDFCSEGRMFDRAGINISAVRKAVGPTRRVLSAAREAGIKIAYLKMAFRSDLSDLGGAWSLVVGKPLVRPANDQRRAANSEQRTTLSASRVN